MTRATCALCRIVAPCETVMSAGMAPPASEKAPCDTRAGRLAQAPMGARHARSRPASESGPVSSSSTVPSPNRLYSLPSPCPARISNATLATPAHACREFAATGGPPGSCLPCESPAPVLPCRTLVHADDDACITPARKMLNPSARPSRARSESSSAVSGLGYAPLTPLRCVRGSAGRWLPTLFVADVISPPAARWR
jgi:hypothetical protein